LDGFASVAMTAFRRVRGQPKAPFSISPRNVSLRKTPQTQRFLPKRNPNASRVAL
jgi:hypothetical protein